MRRPTKYLYAVLDCDIQRRALVIVKSTASPIMRMEVVRCLYLTYSGTAHAYQHLEEVPGQLASHT
jgi:hypothetical protein